LLLRFPFDIGKVKTREHLDNGRLKLLVCWMAPKSKKRTSAGFLDFRKPLYEMKMNGKLWKSWIYDDTQIFLYDISLTNDHCLQSSTINYLEQSNNCFLFFSFS
jgi:hypothetical protein